MSRWARIYIAAVCFGSLVILTTGSIDLDLRQNLVPIMLLTAASFLTQVYELEILPKYLFSTHIAIATTAAFIGGMPLAIWVVVLSTLPAEILLRWDHINSSFGRFTAPVLFNTGQVILSVAAAATVFDAMIDLIPAVNHSYYAMIASFLAYFFANNFLVAGVIALTSDERFFKILHSGFKNLYLQFLNLGVLSILMTTLYKVSPVNLALALAPLALVHHSTRNYLRLRRESHQAFKRITELLAERDEYTGAHSDEVEELAVKLAGAAGLTDDAIEAVRAGAAIHDIGKIAIPDAILKKQGPLDTEEFETMKRHTIIGAEIIKDLDIYRSVVPIVRHEHEHWDGSGYPDGLVREAIPIGARIVAVADVYSALRTERAYRPPQGKPLKYTHKEACRILSEMAGTVLDPHFVEVFLRVVGNMVHEETAGD